MIDRDIKQPPTAGAATPQRLLAKAHGMLANNPLTTASPRIDIASPGRFAYYPAPRRNCAIGFLRDRVKEDRSVSTLRTMIVFAILGAVGYGVYATLNRRPPKDPPEAIPEEWHNVPVVHMPGDGAPPAPSFPGMPSAPIGGHGGEAPPFDASAHPGTPAAAPAVAPPVDAAWNGAPPAAEFAGPPSTTPPDAAFAGQPVAGSPDPNAPNAPPTNYYPAAAALAAPPAPGADLPPAAPDAWPPADASAVGMASAAGGIAPPAGAAAPPYDPAAPAPPHDPAAAAAPPGTPDQFMPAPAPGAYPDPAAQQIPPTDGVPAAAAPFAPVDPSAAPAALGAAPPTALGTTTPPGTDPAEVHAQFASTMSNVKHLLNQDRLADAHLELSRWHGDARLSELEQREVHDLLDQLAGTVVYSRESLVEPPYEVQQGETLQQVADRYQIPWQLLAKINGITDPLQVQPGEKLKVVRGPFSAVVDLNQKHMTLWIENRYAGSFPINVGRDMVATSGTFEVKDKVENPNYYGPDQVIGADDAANPLGEHWISLGQQLGIHGSNDPQGPARADERGCIRLSDRDIHDVFDILSVGSKVVIRR